MICDIQVVNNMVENHSIKEYIQRYEAQFDARIQGIAEEIARGVGQRQIVLVAGPSSCGKTTFTLKLNHALQQLGIASQTVSLDDFYLDRQRAPRKEDGSFDYETVESLDLQEIERCFAQLLEQGSADMPLFSFKLGRALEERKHVELPSNGVVLVEGMHALSSRLRQYFPDEHTLRIYISLRSNLFAGENVLLDKRYLRILRRMVRDYKFRASGPEKTLCMWMDVMDGDMLYVEPFEHTADIRIDSFFPYEAGVLKPMAEQLLAMVPHESRYYHLSQGILQKLERVDVIEETLLPGTSLLREFVGDSIYY
ncbi:MAG: uridine kinase family protein [Eubacteriales bacterium]|jgi:uridine kinase